MFISDLVQNKRWFVYSLIVTILVPGTIIATMAHFAEDMSEDDVLEVAAVAVKNYIDQNPPRQGWRATNTYVDDKKAVVVDVNVPQFSHAKVIKQRNDRIKYSYLKLACPPADAWVFDWLHGDDRIWINLHHQGETIIKAPCPGGKTSGFMAG